MSDRDEDVEDEEGDERLRRVAQRRYGTWAVVQPLVADNRDSHEKQRWCDERDQHVLHHVYAGQVAHAQGCYRPVEGEPERQKSQGKENDLALSQRPVLR